ncbi:MAG: hypothetical protein K0R71_2061 [Bacillales bacterium]|jgi:hypothetical protein|nr:hypothetical protein [Bacillales bacterium]
MKKIIITLLIVLAVVAGLGLGSLANNEKAGTLPDIYSAKLAGTLPDIYGGNSFKTGI